MFGRGTVARAGEEIADNTLLQSLLGIADFCGVDGSAGNCQYESALALNLGYLGLLDLLNDAVVYDMPDMAVADVNHSVFAVTTLNLDFAALLGDAVPATEAAAGSLPSPRRRISSTPTNTPILQTDRF